MPPEALSPSRPRLLVTDLDGTLLTSRRTVTDATVAGLAAARDAGLTLAVASARPLRLIEAVLGPEVIKLFTALIVSNGAAVLDAATGTLLAEQALSPEHTRTAIERLRAQWPGAGFGWEAGTEFGCDAAFLELTRTEPILRDAHPDRVTPEPAGTAHQLVMSVAGIKPAELLAPAAAVLGGAYDVTDSLGGVTEVAPAGVSKATAAALWAKSIGLGLADVVAFGDEHNDLPLLTAAGLGVAMGNAADHVKAAARSVTAGNDEDGVARFLTEHLLPTLRGAQ